MRSDLPDVTAERLPAPDLSRVVLVAAAGVIAAVPLKPAARIVGMQPALALPFGVRLARVDAEIVQRIVAPAGRESCVREPAFRKLVAAVGHVEAAEDAERQHFGRRQLWRELQIEIAALGSAQHIAIAALEFVVHRDGAFCHLVSRRSLMRSRLANAPLPACEWRAGSRLLPLPGREAERRQTQGSARPLRAAGEATLCTSRDVRHPLAITGARLPALHLRLRRMLFQLS